MAGSTYVGDVWKPSIRIRDPRSGEPASLPTDPTARVLPPDRPEFLISLDADGDDWLAEVLLDEPGSWVLIAQSPPPYAGVEPIRRMVLPLPEQGQQA